ncbi:MAG: type II toxin-antitoxin system RelE/ParE family toxin [Crocinitomicaceae bacterium]
MVKIVLRQEAINDLTDIWEYTVYKWSETQADKYYNIIKYACSEIAENPEIGNNYDSISKNLLGFKAGKHIIFYHVVSINEVEVIRILHGMMDLKSKMQE